MLAGMHDQMGRMLLRAGIWAATGRPTPLLENFDSKIELGVFLSRAVREKMVPMLDACARDLALDLGAEPTRLTEVFRHIADAHYQELAGLVDELSTSDIKVMLLKGGDLDLTVYPGTLPRSMADLDLMVKPMHVQAVESALTSAGFQQGIFDRAELTIRPVGRFEKEEAEAGAAELLDYLRVVHLPALSPYRSEILEYLGDSEDHPLVILDRDVFSVLSFDVHVNLSTGFDIQDSWWNPRTIQIPGGREVFGQSYSDLLWFLSARLYHEILLHSRPAMRYFVDVIALLDRFGASIDWERVVSMGQKYKLHPSLYFVFWHVNEILGPVVPGWVIETFDLRRADADRSHDWGDFVPKMLGELAIEPLLV